MSKKRSLSGITATGGMHLGNYLGMIKPSLEMQKDYDCFYFIADLHAFTKLKDPKSIKENVFIQTATWLALGLDTNTHTFYKQSDVPEVTELAWYLSSVTGFGFLEKSHAFKDAQANNKDINCALFSYPILMAADILMYDADIVPVGKDQKQHVEMARDMAGSLNAKFGEDLLKLPEVSIKEEVMLIPGLDGRKMSKSYNNGIPVFAPEKELRKKIMSLTTDSSGLEDSKTMKDTTLGELYSLFASTEQSADLEKRLNAGGLGWGHAKDELFQIINSYFKESRERYYELLKDEDSLLKVLKEGAEKARSISIPVLSRVRDAVGVNL